MAYYIVSFGVMLLCAAIGASASMKVHRAFNKYGNIPTQSRMSGYDTATRLLRANGVKDIRVGKVRGTLSDHYHPKKKEVNLSDSTYGDTSIASVAVAAHEIGHVMQNEKGYPLYKLRRVLVPITNIGTMLAMPLVILGLVLDFAVASTQNSDTGWYLALAGVALYGLSTVFALVTLPVEFNASRRAKKMLVAEGILTEEELPYADKMLDAAANTYVAALLTSMIYFLRFALWVFVMFSNRRDD